MAFNYGFHARHAAVGKFHGIFIENFMQLISWWEAFSYYRQEFFTYVGFHTLIEWGVIPNHIPFPESFALRLRWARYVMQIVLI